MTDHAREREVDDKVDERRKAEDDGHLRDAHGLSGVAGQQGEGVARTEHEFGHGHHGEEGGILDHGDDLTEQRGNDVLEALRQNDVDERLHEVEALRCGGFELASGNGVQAAADDFRNGGRGEQHEGEGAAQKCGGQRRVHVADEHPHEVGGVAENFDVDACEPAEDEFVVAAQKRQNEPEEYAAHHDDDGKLDDEPCAAQKIGEYFGRKGAGNDLDHDNSSSIFCSS